MEARAEGRRGQSSPHPTPAPPFPVLSPSLPSPGASFRSVQRELRPAQGGAGCTLVRRSLLGLRDMGRVQHGAGAAGAPCTGGRRQHLAATPAGESAGTCMPSSEPTEPGRSSRRLESPQVRQRHGVSRTETGRAPSHTHEPHPPAPGWAWLMPLHQGGGNPPPCADLTAWCKMSCLLQHMFHRDMRDTHAFGCVDTQRSV